MFKLRGELGGLRLRSNFEKLPFTGIILPTLCCYGLEFRRILQGCLKTRNLCHLKLKFVRRPLKPKSPKTLENPKP